jgi:hypothetical protein
MRSSALILAAIVLQACSINKEPTIDYIHSNGLSLKLPAVLSAHQLSDGFVVQLAASLQDRAPKQVFVTLRQGASMPAGEWLERKSVAGRLFPFRLDREEGGSGGVSHKLTAWSPYADGYVLIIQVAQAEWPTVPDHSLAWMVMDAIREPEARDVK